MECVAPGAGPTCNGSIDRVEGVPLCAAHMSALSDLTGPWKTHTGSREWLSAMRDVVTATLALEERAITLEEASAGKPKAPWINWDDPNSKEKFKWATQSGDPCWDTADINSRYSHLIDYSKYNKKPGKKRWNPNAWWLRKKKKAS